MDNIIEIAKDIAKQTLMDVIVINNREFWVARNSDINLYNPSEFNFQNTFVGKPVDQKYIEGDNHHEINHILEKTQKFKVVLPHVYKDIQIISAK